MAISDSLEAHFYAWCLTLDQTQFDDLAAHHPHYTPTLFSRARRYAENTARRRPLAKPKLLELRHAMLDLQDQKEAAMEDYPTVRMDALFTEAQLARLVELVTEGGPGVRSLIIREVFDGMTPPPEVHVRRTVRGELEMYGDFLPAYLAYAVIYAVNATRP